MTEDMNSLVHLFHFRQSLAPILLRSNSLKINSSQHTTRSISDVETPTRLLTLVFPRRSPSRRLSRRAGSIGVANSKSKGECATASGWRHKLRVSTAGPSGMADLFAEAEISSRVSRSRLSLRKPNQSGTLNHRKRAPPSGGEPRGHDSEERTGGDRFGQDLDRAYFRPPPGLSGRPIDGRE